jgi:hypothetical protein
VQPLLDLLLPEYWPIWVGLAVLLIAALFYQLTSRVPNAFTFSAMAAAWMTAALMQLQPGILPPTAGGLVSSMVATAAGLLMLGKLYKLGLGAGCLKTQMAFGAWLGCALSLEPALLMTVLATLIGGSTTVLIQIAVGRFRGKPVEELVVGDEPAAESLPFPAQTTLALGSVGGVLLFFVVGASYLPHNKRQAAAQQPAIMVQPAVAIQPAAAPQAAAQDVDP